MTNIIQEELWFLGHPFDWYRPIMVILPMEGFEDVDVVPKCAYGLSKTLQSISDKTIVTYIAPSETSINELACTRTGYYRIVTMIDNMMMRELCEHILSGENINPKWVMFILAGDNGIKEEVDAVKFCKNWLTLTKQ